MADEMVCPDAAVEFLQMVREGQSRQIAAQLETNKDILLAEEPDTLANPFHISAQAHMFVYVSVFMKTKHPRLAELINAKRKVVWFIHVPFFVVYYFDVFVMVAE
jgi:hypothetical protein